MKKMVTLFALAAIVAGVGIAGAAEYGKVYNGTEIVHGLITDGDGTGCGALAINADGSYENGFCWQYGGVADPYYGAFAECYSAANQSVCSVVLDLTSIGYPNGTSDVYVWADGGGSPGNVLCLVAGYLPPGPIATWPSFTRVAADVSGCCVDGSFWAGYRGNFATAICGYFIGADLDGFGGCPYTNVAPGIGYPTGWNNASVIWGPTQALGIGVELTDCGGTAVETTTWGAIKGLYN